MPKTATSKLYQDKGNGISDINGKIESSCAALLISGSYFTTIYMKRCVYKLTFVEMCSKLIYYRYTVLARGFSR